ncbi:MAG: hypothetical protein HDS70_05675 [Bacteroidales bacterium]|nr:hypothetical protein [Bacteroidales bacterium]
MKRGLFRSIFKMMLAILMLPLAACESQEDKLVGEWGKVFGIAPNSYTGYRVYRPNGPGSTMVENFTFTKGEDGKKGKFVDSIFPLMPGENVVVGSNLTGEWEVKGQLLYLYFDHSIEFDGLELTGTTDKLDFETEYELRQEMAQILKDEYIKACKSGIPYRIVEKNGKTGLEIEFPGGAMTLVKSDEKK